MAFSDLEVVMKVLHNEGKFADMTISCNGHNFKAHRAIVCPQSSFFDCALEGRFKEGISNLVDLPEDDVDTIDRILSFCYFQDYDQGDNPSPINSGEIAHNNFRVYMAADKFSIHRLRELAMTRTVTWANSNWASEDFPKIVQEIWRLSPPHERKLRDAVADVVSTHALHFLSQDNGRIVLVENPNLAVDVLERVAKKNDDLRESRFRRR